MAEGSGTKGWIHCSIKFLVKMKNVFYFYLKAEDTFWPTQYEGFRVAARYPQHENEPKCQTFLWKSLLFTGPLLVCYTATLRAFRLLLTKPWEDHLLILLHKRFLFEVELLIQGALEPFSYSGPHIWFEFLISISSFCVITGSFLHPFMYQFRLQVSD